MLIKSCTIATKYFVLNIKHPTFTSMKTFTEKEALEEIFNEKRLSCTMRSMKFRYKNGTLSNRTIAYILKDHKFVIVQPVLYKIKKR